MPIARYQLPDGRIARFQVPEGTTPEQAQGMAAQFFNEQQSTGGSGSGTATDDIFRHTDYTSGMSGGYKFLAGVGKAFVDLGQGAQQAIGDALPDDLRKAYGLPTREDVDARKQLDADLMKSRAGIAGNIVGNVAAAAPAMAIPGANTAVGAAATGAVLGALQPVGTNDSRIENAAIGGAAGAVGNAIPRVAARIVNPVAAKASEALAKAGITDVTPGQALGGIAKTVEDKLTSLPLAGPVIQKAQAKGVESFNKAAINHTLAPVGESIDDIGHDGIKKAGQIISDKYNALLPDLKVQTDKDFIEHISQIRTMAADLPEDIAKQYDNIIKSNVIGKFTTQGNMSGETMKQVDSRLGQLARNYKGSTNPDQRQLGDALFETQSALRQMVERANPEQAPALSKINEAYANFIRVQKAAGMQGAKDGIFTPNQLLNAVRASDQSLRKGAFAKGEARMQDFAELANRSLSSKYPDSGTAGRALLAMGAGGAYLTNPALAAGEASLAAVYGTSVGKRALMALLAKRPESASAVAAALSRVAPTAGRVGAGVGATYLEQQ